MLRGPLEFLWAGFAVAAVGFAALNYMSYRMTRHYLPRDLGHPFEVRYWSAIKRQVGIWPICVAGICILFGIAVIAAAIVCNNHLKLK